MNKKIKPGRVLVFLILLAYAAFILLPFYTILVTSITPNTETMSSLKFVWWPDSVTAENYYRLFAEDPFLDELMMPSLINGFFNTIWTSLITVVISLLTSGLAAYAYTNLQVPYKETIFRIQLATMMVPLGAFLVTAYLFYTQIGWVGTYLPLMIPAMFGGSGAIFFLRTYMKSIPPEIFEAAKIDGYGTMRIFFKFVFPLSIPAFTAQFIFAFVGRYNAYMGPMLYLDEPQEYTLQLALYEIMSYFGGDQVGVNCAGAVMALLPMIIVFLFSEQFFIEGVAVNGGKE